MAPSCCQKSTPPSGELSLSVPSAAANDTDICCAPLDEQTLDVQAKEDAEIDTLRKDQDCAPVDLLADRCQDNCCQAETDTNIKTNFVCCDENFSDDCCGPKVTPSCAAGDTTMCTSEEESCAEECCAQNDAEPLHANEGDVTPPTLVAPVTKDCCGTANKQSIVDKAAKSEAPDCCRGKTSPCCDESCLDRLALRDCEAKSTAACVRDDTSAFTSCCEAKEGCSDAIKGGNACDGHSRAIRERYGATLEALGCICRALIALGQESCCETRRPSKDKQRCCKKRSTKSLRQNQDSCCGSDASAKSSFKINAPGLRKRSGACCSGKEKQVESTCVGDSCCQPGKLEAKKTSCIDSCCADPPHDIMQKGDEKGPKQIPQDVEKQSSGHEHVVLCVSGMTCTGCETKLNRTLATFPGIQNLKTSLVLSRAEFNLDLSLASIDEAMKHLERTTEFKCERVVNQGAFLDLVVPGGPSAFINTSWPAGVTDMSTIDKDIVRVRFDARIVGARDLIEQFRRHNIVLAPVRGDPSLEAGNKHVRHVGYTTIFSAILTVPVLVLAWAPLPERPIAYSSASLALATIVQVFVAGPFYPKALKALVFSRVIEMDLLIVMSTSAAYIFSVVSFGYLVAGKPLSTGQFFETATLLVTLIMVGRYVAALARQRAVESISLRSLQTQTALLADGITNENQEIDARLLQYGDFFKILPDTRIPTDGTVVSGSSEVDESMLTGESLPVEKYPKSTVIAGTLNGSGTLVVRLTRLPSENTINTIATMVDGAKLSKPKMQDLADKIASYFVPVIIALTVLTFVIWMIVGVTVQVKTGSEAAVQALTYAITVLIVSCPCAIGLAVPMVIVIASGIAAERGVIFKSADAIEVASKASHVVFDKTGTLTEGKLAVSTEKYMAENDSDLSLLLGLIENSRHPVSVAVARHLKVRGIVASPVSNVTSLTGKGLEGEASSRILQAGNSRWLNTASHAAVKPILEQGHTVFCFMVNGLLCAVFGLNDSLRHDAKDTVETLQSMGVSVHIVSGDENGAVQIVATKLGIPELNTHSRSSPSDKQAYIKQLQDNDQGRIKPVIIFCGDGTNDAVALAQATIGVHMSEGTEVAQSAADVVLMRPDLSGVITMMNASKQSVRRIKFNFGWSFVYNAFAILLAAGAFVKARIPPEFGGLGELVSVLPVIIAAVLLRWTKI